MHPSLATRNSQLATRLSSSKSTRGFTFVEFLVAIAIIGLILASIVPFVLAQREASRRIRCADNLRVIYYALSNYRKDFQESSSSYPRTRFDPGVSSWTAYTGADDANPFAATSAVQANDASAALWLLVRIGYTPDTSVFICPSSDRVRDPMTSASGTRVTPAERGNFRSGRNLAYSIFNPYNNQLDTDPKASSNWTDTLPGDCVLLADMNPGIAPGGADNVTKPAAGDDASVQALANSRNHSKAGQNVLYAGGRVEFVPHPFVGMGYVRANTLDPKTQKTVPPRTGDNIYTSLTASPNTPDGKSPPDGAGAFGKSIGPSWQYDSYLVPSDDD